MDKRKKRGDGKEKERGAGVSRVGLFSKKKGGGP